MATGNHLAAEALTQDKNGIEIDVDDHVPLLDRIIRGRLSIDRSSIVDEYVNRAGHRLGLVGHPGKLVAVCCVGGKLPRLASRGSHRRCSLHASTLASADGNHIGG